MTNRTTRNPSSEVSKQQIITTFAPFNSPAAAHPCCRKERTLPPVFLASRAHQRLRARTRWRKVFGETRKGLFLHENSERGGEVHDIWFYAMYWFVFICVHVPPHASGSGSLGSNHASIREMFWVSNKIEPPNCNAGLFAADFSRRSSGIFCYPQKYAICWRQRCWYRAACWCFT